MKIQSVQIKNFRTLKDVTIPFDSVTTFIGPNGAGKSTVLRALDWYFNGKPGSLSDKDCSFGATDDDIEVAVTFADLSERDRNELGKYAPPEVATFTARKRRSPNAGRDSFCELEELSAIQCDSKQGVGRREEDCLQRAAHQ
ncbi:AAA family ATPase [Variovorax sp. J2P1-59]|nr:AAA family ATPase [Variovorax sp. J2P1-59]MDM0077644.1 AAA family ATPase [Variovorax sp. J2P1-59]